MSVLEQLEPKRVFRFFEELCAIPHGSGNTKAIGEWCMAFAAARGLEAHRDGLGNVILIREATPGYESAEPVILQGHLDMVCEQAADCPKDMAAEGLDLRVEGDWISARGTTLGGDDGIAVAMALAVLDDDALPHPRVEAVLTVDEEVGLLGAAGLDVSPLRGRRLLNIDSEEEGIFTVSCAGGNRTTCTLPVRREPFAGTVLRITVGGLLGGHSGAEIHKGRASSNQLMGRLLAAAQRSAPLRLAAVSGGLKDNAIALNTEAVVVTENGAAVRSAVETLGRRLREEYHTTDPGVTVRVEETAAAIAPMDDESTRRCVAFLACFHQGVQAYSAEIPGLVQSSLNLGILGCDEGALRAVFCVRSSVDSQKQMLTEQLRVLTEQLHGVVEVCGDYPGWAYRTDSPLRELLVAVFREQYGRDPKIEAIHAGLECGMLLGKLPELDCVSFGPDLLEIHTVRERMSIASVQRVWAMLTETLRRMN